MADQFFGFSPEAFEQFVRSLALTVFGPGVTAFGNGPDGGREASFRGKVPYPYPPTDTWSGYGVIQAKCKEKSESTEKDQKWALEQLKPELDTFVSSRKREPKPEYYVFVCNVELSSTAGGGKDQANELVQSYYGKLPLKGHALWDANQLAPFLAKYEGLRKRFIAYLTPGDVLAAMLAEIERKRLNATQILTAFVERELRSDESARLDQAGNRTDEQLQLARLFFDLPASPEPQLVPPVEQPDAAGRLPPGILRDLLRGGSRKLDPKTVYDQETSQSPERFPARYVLLGGPGSGKSTVGQFLAQMHRAALLSRREPYLLQPETRIIIEETRALCEQEGLSWPATPRYPFRVELNRFAKALASKDSDGVASLERYLLNALKREHSLTHEDLLQWLATYPWLLVLDGLDEVPATSNRDALVKAVNDFLAEAWQVEADLFVVATSRQQGYGREFSSGVTASRYILPLSTTRAVRYVKRYADARFGISDPNRAKDIVEKLSQSATRDLTAQLMSSPLQVTFMATVVAAKGDPGDDRWQLFDSYYRTVYDRERQKAVPPYNTVLSKQQPLIDRLHHDIGFWLQYQGEASSKKAVSLPISQFERVVDTYLAEDGHEGAEKDDLVRLIAEAAHQRLIFLTNRVEGELSFEVRSLQEYMAAECLMTGDQEVVKTRLRAIAPAPYWRNVFLFAAGKCFANAQSRHLQDTIRILCDDLNNPGDPLLAATRAGSELALDVLQSGAVAENPNHARHLTRIAMSLLAQPYLKDESAEGAAADQRLASVFRDQTVSIYKDTLELRVGQSDVQRTFGAWALLLRLVSRGEAWAVELAEQNWPTDYKAQFEVLRILLGEMAATSWMFTKLVTLIPYLTPAEAWPIVDSLRIEPRAHTTENGAFVGALARIFDYMSMRTFAVRLGSMVSSRKELEIHFLPVIRETATFSELYASVARMPAHNPGWLPYIFAIDLLRAPNRYTLSNVLRRCAEGGWTPYERPHPIGVPWPLADCLAVARSVDELKHLADLVEQGTIGDADDWRAAEERWTTVGVGRDDFIYRPPGPFSFDASIGSRGLPTYGTGLSINKSSYPNELLLELGSIARELPAGKRCADILWFLCRASAETGGLLTSIDPTGLRALLQQNGLYTAWYENVVGFAEESNLRDRWLEFFDWLGHSDCLDSRYFANNVDGRWARAWEEAFMLNPSKSGLLRVLGRVASIGRTTHIPATRLELASFSEPAGRLAALLLRLTQPALSDKESSDLAAAAAELLEPQVEPGAEMLIFRTVGEHLLTVRALESFLLHLRERIPRRVELGQAKCELLLRRIMRRRSSGLQRPGEPLKLQLPVIMT